MPPLDEASFAALYHRLRRVPAWGPADRRGALNYLTPALVQAAASEVRLGRSVSLAAPIETGLTPDQPEPAIHVMTGQTGDQADPEGLTFDRATGTAWRDVVRFRRVSARNGNLRC